MTKSHGVYLYSIYIWAINLHFYKIYFHCQCHIFMCHTPQNIFFMSGPWVVGRNIFFMSQPWIVGRNIFFMAGPWIVGRDIFFMSGPWILGRNISWLKIFSGTNKSFWGPSSRKKRLLYFHHWGILGNCSFVCRCFPEAVGACCLVVRSGECFQIKKWPLFK
jgi:hypothetical protein